MLGVVLLFFFFSKVKWDQHLLHSEYCTSLISRMILTFFGGYVALLPHINLA